MIKWKTLYNKNCRSCFIKSRTVEFVFFRFFYDFISILQVYCLMHPGRQDLNVIFFTFRSCRPLDGRQAPIFEKFLIWYIFLKFCFFFKYKNEKGPRRRRGWMTRWMLACSLGMTGRRVLHSCFSCTAHFRRRRPSYGPTASSVDSWSWPRFIGPPPNYGP